MGSLLTAPLRALGAVGRALVDAVRWFLRAKMLWIGTLMILLFWGVAAYVQDSSSLLEFEQISRMSISLAVVLAYSSIFVSALLARRPDHVAQLSMGIFLTWTSTVAISLWALIYRLGGKPAWMLDSELYGFLVHIQVLGGILHITSPGAVGGGIPRRNLISLGVTCGAALFIFLILVGLDPDVNTIVEYLESWLRR